MKTIITGFSLSKIQYVNSARSEFSEFYKKSRKFPFTKHHMKLVFPSILLNVLLLLLLSVTCMATPNRITPKSPLLIGGNKDLAPFEFQNSEEVPDGFTIELMKAIARNEGLNIKFKLDLWSITLNNLKAGKIDAVTGMMYSKERDEIFDFSIPYKIIPYMIFIRKGSPIRSIDDLNEKEIILVEDVHAYEWVIKNKITKSIIRVNETVDALKLLASGKHDCTILPRLHGLDRLDDLEIDNIETVGSPILKRYFCFAVAEGNSDLLAELNEGLFDVQLSGEYDEIHQKWFSVHEHEKRIGRLTNYVLFILGTIMILLCSFLFWNWSLKRKIAQKTKDLSKNQSRLNQIVEGIPIPTYVVDETHTVTHWNKACEIITGIKSDKIIGTKNYSSAFYDERTYSTIDLLMDNVLTQRIQQYENTKYRESKIVTGAYEAEYYVKSMDMDRKCFYITAALLRDQAGEIDGAIETWQDLTEYKQLEKQLIQSQKMEAIGTLAGGIAHDFNNILSAVIGCTELVLYDELPPNAASRKNLEKVLQAGLRAKELVKQILTFSRQTQYEKLPIQLDPIIKEVLELIRASLPSNIEIRHSAHADNSLILCEPNQIHQVLMNLCTNAGYAMRKNGGVLEVVLSTVEYDGVDPQQHAGMKPGSYVTIAVTDTGEGMMPSVIEQIFNPFFTTKPKDEGTGLGLSVVHGIVTEHGGTIRVDSQQGKGTTFTVHLPLLFESKEIDKGPVPLGSQ